MTLFIINNSWELASAPELSEHSSRTSVQKHMLRYLPMMVSGRHLSHFTTLNTTTSGLFAVNRVIVLLGQQLKMSIKEQEMGSVPMLVRISR